VSAYRKVPGAGPRCVRVGNACLWALGQMHGSLGIEQLAVLKVKLKGTSLRAGVDRALEAASKRLGLSAADLDELTVPTYGFDGDGWRTGHRGEHKIEIVLTETSEGELRYLRPSGSRLRSVPAMLKTSHGPALKELAQCAKDIQQMVAAQKHRIE